MAQAKGTAAKSPTKTASTKAPTKTASAKAPATQAPPASNADAAEQSSTAAKPAEQNAAASAEQQATAQTAQKATQAGKQEKPGEIEVLMIRTVRGVARFRRAGFTFTREPIGIEVAALSVEQIEALSQEKRLEIVEGSIGSGEAAE